MSDSVGDTTLKIKRRGEDGYKLISVRIKEETLEALDKLAAETNYRCRSRHLGSGEPAGRLRQ